MRAGIVKDKVCDMEPKLTLGDFIKTSLVEIVNAVQEARKLTGGSKSPIGKYIYRSESEEDGELETETITTGILTENPITEVAFDMAVVISESKSRQVQGSGEVKGEMIFVASAEASVSGEAAREHTNTRESRIKFSVPVGFLGSPLTVHTSKKYRVTTEKRGPIGGE